MTANEVQRAVDDLRDGVLGGRGPGASADELAAHQRDRDLLGALPCASERAIVAVQTAAARGAARERAVAALGRIRRTWS